MKRSPLRRISVRRLAETRLYRFRIQQFLFRHPYCQVWLTEHGISEAEAIQRSGLVHLMDGSRVMVPLATEVHHRNKRRGWDLLDQSEWLAVSREAHRRIESEKTWAREQGFLREF